MPAGVAESRHALVGGYSEHVGKITDTRKQKGGGGGGGGGGWKHQKCRSNTHRSWGNVHIE